jgi:threonine/homoserine/homoserine lactone efflux protein
MLNIIAIISLFIVAYAFRYLARRYLSRSALDLILKILIVLFILFGIYLYYVFSQYEKQKTILQNKTLVINKR